MVDRTGIRELEISMSFVDLLEVCLQETTSYAASEHDVFLRTEESVTRRATVVFKKYEIW